MFPNFLMKLQILFCKVCGVKYHFYVFSLYRNIDLLDGLFTVYELSVDLTDPVFNTLLRQPSFRWHMLF